MPTLTSVTLEISINKIALENPEIDRREYLRVDADERAIPCEVIAGKQYGRHGESNDARDANTALVDISHPVSSTGVGKTLQCAQAEDQ